MAAVVRHSKIDHITDWTQARLDQAISDGQFSAGTVLADIVLPSDWNADHVVSGVVETGSVKRKLTENETYYVRTDGSDGNTGTANSSADAWATLQHAWDEIADTLDIGPFTVTVQIEDGDYTESPLFLAQQTGRVVIQGNTGDQTAVTIDGFIQAQNSGVFCVLQYLTITGTNGCFVISGTTCQWYANRIDFYNAGALSHLTAANGAVLNVLEPVTFFSSHYTVTGTVRNASIHLNSESNAILYVYAYCTLVGTPAFGSYGFAYARSLAALNASFYPTGSATGRRYRSTLNAVINTRGGGANYFPGDTAGLTATGGQYA